MKHFKLFEQFIQDLDNSVNESNKWTKEELESLAKFAKKLSKVDPKEFDPATYKGVQTAVMNLKGMTDSIYMLGDEVWNLQNRDKCKPVKSQGSSWVEATPEEADKGDSMTEEYLKACEDLLQEGLKALKLVEKGEGEKLASILPGLEAYVDKWYKLNRKWQKSKGVAGWTPKKEYSEESQKFSDEFAIKILKMFQNATSNKAAIDEIQERINNFTRTS
jgi:hypothetical protein